MKKILTLLIMMILVTGLVACNNDSVNKDKVDDQNKTEDSAQNDNQSKEDDAAVNQTKDDAVTEASIKENENFQQVLSILKDAGLELGEVTPGMNDIPGSITSMNVSISGEDMLVFQVYEMEPGNENLKTAKESGTAILEFEGQQGEVEGFYAIDNYIFFLGEGHPDFDTVKKALEENFTAK